MTFVPAQNLSSDTQQVTLFRSQQLPEVDAQAIATALKLKEGAQVFMPDEVNAVLNSGQRVVLVWATLEDVLARAIEQASPSNKILADWAQEVASILSVFRAHRRDMVMVPGDVLTDAACFRQLALRLDVTDAPPQDIMPWTCTYQQALARLAAPHYAPSLQEEMIASSLPVARVPVSPDLLDIAIFPLQDWQRQRDQVEDIKNQMVSAGGEGPLNEARAENLLLREQLVLTQKLVEEWQEAWRLDRDRAFQSDALNAKELSALRQALSDAELRHNSRLSEIEIILNTAQTELNTSRLKHKDLEQLLALARRRWRGCDNMRKDLGKQLAVARREIERRRAWEAAIYMSTSWKLTAPLRLLGASLAKLRK